MFPDGLFFACISVYARMCRIQPSYAPRRDSPSRRLRRCTLSTRFLVTCREMWMVEWNCHRHVVDGSVSAYTGKPENLAFVKACWSKITAWHVRMAPEMGAYRRCVS